MPTVVDAEPRQPVQRALIGFLFDQHGVAARKQRLVDEVERLQRTRNDHDVVGGAGDAGIALELCGEEFAQGTIALRAAGEAVGRERLALAPEHGIDRLDQAVDRHLVGIVVAADETVFGKARPPRRRRRQSGRQQWCEIEGDAVDMDVHSRLFFVEKALRGSYLARSGSCRVPGVTCRSMATNFARLRRGPAWHGACEGSTAQARIAKKRPILRL